MVFECDFYLFSELDWTLVKEEYPVASFDKSVYENVKGEMNDMPINQQQVSIVGLHLDRGPNKPLRWELLHSELLYFDSGDGEWSMERVKDFYKIITSHYLDAARQQCFSYVAKLTERRDADIAIIHDKHENKCNGTS